MFREMQPNPYRKSIWLGWGLVQDQLRDEHDKKFPAIDTNGTTTPDNESIDGEITGDVNI